MKTMKQLPLLFFAVLLFSTASATVSEAQDKTGGMTASNPIVVYQSKFPIVLDGREFDLLNMVIDFPTGAGFPAHFHGGYVLATVLSGEVTLTQNNAEKVYKTGESWTENPGEVHSAMNKGASARVSVSMLLPKGAEVTTFVK